MAFSGSPNRWEENTTTATWVSGECKDLAVITTPLCRLHNIQSPTCRQWKWEKLKRATSCWILVSANRNRKLWNGAVSRRRKKKKNHFCQCIPTNTVPAMLIFHLLPFSARAVKKICDPLWCHKGHFESYASGVMTGMPLVTTPPARFQTANGHPVCVILMAIRQ